jgi:hypothetical protein
MSYLKGRNSYVAVICAQLDNVTHETTTSAYRPPTFTVHDYNILIEKWRDPGELLLVWVCVHRSSKDKHSFGTIFITYNNKAGTHRI